MAREQVSFTTCNLLNLNEPGLPLYGQDGWTQAQYNTKIEWLGWALRSMKADVFGFQELWHAKSLDAALKAAGLDQTHVPLVPAGHKGGGIVCGGAVRSDILVGEPEWIADFHPDFLLKSKGDDKQTAGISVALKSFSRPVLHFTIKPSAKAGPIHVYVCHLKSKRPTRIDSEKWYDKDVHAPYADPLGGAIATIRRTAEAAALRMLLIDRLRKTDNAAVVLGDINDGTLSNTANILTGQPSYLMGFSVGGVDAGLYTAQTLQQYRSTRDVYYTHVYKNERESLDHILVSQELYDNSRKRVWEFAGLDIFNDHLNDHNHKLTGSTDHGIVRATFELNPAKTAAGKPA
jgi:endonuclease/exonuclease/phosphatase family metal-dependent hydrolase